MEASIKGGAVQYLKSPRGQAGFRQLYARYRNRAKRMSRRWALSEKELLNLTSGDCFYCGVGPKRIVQGAHNESLAKAEHTKYMYNSIDRKNSKLGYTRKNCVPSCHSCNMVKQEIEIKLFFEKLKRIAQSKPWEKMKKN